MCNWKYADEMSLLYVYMFRNFKTEICQFMRLLSKFQLWSQNHLSEYVEIQELLKFKYNQASTNFSVIRIRTKSANGIPAKLRYCVKNSQK